MRRPNKLNVTFRVLNIKWHNSLHTFCHTTFIFLNSKRTRGVGLSCNGYGNLILYKTIFRQRIIWFNIKKILHFTRTRQFSVNTLKMYQRVFFLYICSSIHLYIPYATFFYICSTYRHLPRWYIILVWSKHSVVLLSGFFCSISSAATFCSLVKLKVKL